MGKGRDGARHESSEMQIHLVSLLAPSLYRALPPVCCSGERLTSL